MNQRHPFPVGAVSAAHFHSVFVMHGGFILRARITDHRFGRSDIAHRTEHILNRCSLRADCTAAEQHKGRCTERSRKPWNGSHSSSSGSFLPRSASQTTPPTESSTAPAENRTGSVRFQPVSSTPPPMDAASISVPSELRTE